MTEREELARIIDPEAWADWDRFSSYTNEDGPTDWKEFARRRTTPSLAKADQWLSRPSPVDGLKATLAEATSATMMAEMRADKLMAENAKLREALTNVFAVLRKMDDEYERDEECDYNVLNSCVEELAEMADALTPSQET
jgi:hypothetical protein